MSRKQKAKRANILKILAIMTAVAVFVGALAGAVKACKELFSDPEPKTTIRIEVKNEIRTAN